MMSRDEMFLTFVKATRSSSCENTREGNMIALTTNTRGSTVMSKSLAEMGGPELVVEFNRLAAIKGIPLVKRFADRKAGIRRIEALKIEPKPKQKGDGSKIVETFGVRQGTNRQKLLDKLGGSMGQQVPRDELLKVLYDTTDKKWRGALNMVFSGLLALIKKKRLPYKIVKEKKEASFGLYSA